MASLIFLNLFLTVINIVNSAPLNLRSVPNPDFKSQVDKEVNKYLDKFLNSYYEKYIRNTPFEYEILERNAKSLEDAVKKAETMSIYDVMQGDQPQNIQSDLSNSASSDYITQMKNRKPTKSREDRAKEQWLNSIKTSILQQIGRSNFTSNTLNPTINEYPPINYTQLFQNNIFNGTTIEEDFITEKIRSYYPSCNNPTSSAENELWNDDNVMNLYFDYINDEHSAKIATATLRLYRLPNLNTTHDGEDNCTHISSEEERLLRVSIYWYTKTQKKRKAKRRLCDSKVISEEANWVELSVKPATRAWVKGKNLGLALLVEDQEGNTLKADTFFKGATCSVGMTTPKPIPTILRDATRTNHELNQLFGRTSTTSFSSDISLLPIIDICTLEFANNSTALPSDHPRSNACNLRTLHEQQQKAAERDRLERLAALTRQGAPPVRHLRHQRQQHHHHSPTSGLENSAPHDIRSQITQKRVLLKREDLEKLNLNLTNFNRYI